MTLRLTRAHTFAALIAGLAIGSLVSGCGHDHHDARPGWTGYCDDGGCFQCTPDGACNPLNRPQCRRNADCNKGEVCADIGCTRACGDQFDCDPGDRCVDGYCAPKGFSKVNPYTPPSTCKADADCAADRFCSGGSCVPRCKSDDDCGPGKVCAACGKCQKKETPATCGTAVSYCSGAASCGDGKTCVGNRCHFQCKSSVSCPVGQVCSGGLCKDDPSPKVPECALNSDCNGGSCINGYCHGACKTTSQCGAGNLCLMGVCQPDYHPAN